MQPPAGISVTFSAHGRRTSAVLTRRVWHRGMFRHRLIESWSWPAGNVEEGIGRLLDDLEAVHAELVEMRRLRAVPEAPREPRTGRWGADQCLPLWAPHSDAPQFRAGLDDLDNIL